MNEKQQIQRIVYSCVIFKAICAVKNETFSIWNFPVWNVTNILFDCIQEYSMYFLTGTIPGFRFLKTEKSE